MKRLLLRHHKPHQIITAVREWGSISFSQKPRRMMLWLIGLTNLMLVLVAAWVISRFALPGNVRMGFFTAVYNTFMMILDAGCIESIISDPGSTNLFLIVFCLVIIIISMITFTGSLIGYVSDFISNKIENANTNSQPIKISDHVVILGWNTRASEIVNDLLYCPGHQRVVVLTESSRESIIREVEERLADTIERENEELRNSIRQEPMLQRLITSYKKKLRNNIDFIVREGDIFSLAQLRNIQLEKAKSIIILSDNSGSHEDDIKHDYDFIDDRSDNLTIKTLMQVIDITSRHSSNDNQKVVVEVDNDWTEKLVRKIIKSKQQLGKCRVVPFRVHRVMGQLLCQFALMPELNMVFKELFSNKGATFYALPQSSYTDTGEYISGYFTKHHRAIPLSQMKDDLEGRNYFYYMANDAKDINEMSEKSEKSCNLELNKNYWINEKHVLILGCNSRIENILNSFNSFCGEWTDENHHQILHVTILDGDERILHSHFSERYSFVDDCIVIEINNEKKINQAISDFVCAHPDDSSILILSDDNADSNNIDAEALTYLIYAKDIISRVRTNRHNEQFNVDIIVEIIDPKHYDIVKSYDVSNVVISNRYISKMITQISENYALYNFYVDMMTYDDADTIGYDSNEVYIKRAGDYYSILPEKNASMLSVIQNTYAASKSFWSSKSDFALLLGYVDTIGKMHLFKGDLANNTVTLTSDDKLIMYSNH